MPNEFGRAPCPGCGQMLHLALTEENFGSIVAVRCDGCGKTFPALIPHPAGTQNETAESLEFKRMSIELSLSLTELLKRSPELHEGVERFKRAGFDISVMLAVAITDKESPPTGHETPADAFNAQDGQWLKKLKIDLGS